MLRILNPHRTSLAIVALLGTVLLLGGCGRTHAERGAALGAGMGAIAGAVLGHNAFGGQTAEGAAIGAGVGALAGAILGDIEDSREHREYDHGYYEPPAHRHYDHHHHGHYHYHHGYRYHYTRCPYCR